ncbi:hypothetical protein ACFLVF_00100 [Chloroflexota bacterium]
MKMGRPKETASLRSIGATAVPCDVSTRARLKVLAGDMPVSHYLRGIAFGYIKPPAREPQETLNGQEKTISLNTFEAVASETRKNTDELVNLRDGQVKLMSDLSGIEQVLTKMAMALNITIDVEKWSGGLIKPGSEKLSLQELTEQ